MLWRDFFYFSKGERSGLILLLSIIVIAGTILYVNRTSEPVPQQSDVQKTNEILISRDSTGNMSLDSVSQRNETKNTGEAPTVSTRTTSSNPSSSGSTGRMSSDERNTRESVSERVNRLTSNSQQTYVRVEKFEKGTVVELNTADTTILKKVPGIGSAFANRIVNYRTILKGYYSVTQLSEVYGIDEERYQALQSWFTADPALIQKIEVNQIAQDSLHRHPYLNYAQARVIIQQRRQKGKLTGWENLQLLNEFTENDKIRLQPYLSFE